MKKKVVILSGAGISAESGIRTFRDANGLWNEYKIEDVCTSEAWDKNPTLVNDFYNMRRIDVLNAVPNTAHKAIVDAEEFFDIQVITTNIDDLHERAGSSKVKHLHGQVLKARSSRNGLGFLSDYLLAPHLVDVGREGIKPYQEADDGHLLRPHVVFFGEDVPELQNAAEIIREADALIVVGTSLNVYPAASLVRDVKEIAPVFYIDPTEDTDAGFMFPCSFINERATVGVPMVLDKLKLTFGLTDAKQD